MKKSIILLSAILLTSCASRKVNKSTETEKTEIKTEVKDTLVKRTEVKRIDNIFVVDEEIEITPSDTSKPIIIKDESGKTKTYLNAVLKAKKKKTNRNIETDIKVAENSKKEVKKEVKNKKSVEVKQTERKSYFNWWWLLVLIPIYFIYKKIKPSF